jgi:hypothetical protein
LRHRRPERAGIDGRARIQLHPAARGLTLVTATDRAHGELETCGLERLSNYGEEARSRSYYRSMLERSVGDRFSGVEGAAPVVRVVRD